MLGLNGFVPADINFFRSSAMTSSWSATLTKTCLAGPMTPVSEVRAYLEGEAVPGFYFLAGDLAHPKISFITQNKDIITFPQLGLQSWGGMILQICYLSQQKQNRLLSFCYPKFFASHVYRLLLETICRYPLKMAFSLPDEKFVDVRGIVEIR